MPVIRRRVTAATANALQGLKFSIQKRPAAVSLWYAVNTATESFSFGVDDNVITDSTFGNVEAGAGIIDSSRDQVLFREPVPAGTYYLDIPTVTTEHLYMLNIEVL